MKVLHGAWFRSFKQINNDMIKIFDTLVDKTKYSMNMQYPIVVTYEIRVFFEGAEKEVFSSILKKIL